MRRPRRLLVRVVEMSVGDGALAPPRVGAVTDFPVGFVEVGSAFVNRRVRDAEVMTVRGVLELEDRGPFEHHDHESAVSYWMWQGLLRGDGWTATWHGTRPLTGPVELTGYFTSALNVDNPGRVRGRITRVRIISEAYRPVDDSWEVIGGAPAHYRDVQRAPHFHGDDVTATASGMSYRDTAILIDLDLDDVAPPPVRPRVVPGHVSVAGDLTVWVSDTELPVVARIDTRANDAVEYVLPGLPADFRRVYATPTGCWATEPPAVYRITAGEGAYRVADVGAAIAAVSGETLLAHHATRGWTLYAPDRPPLPVDLPDSETIGFPGVDRHTGDFVLLSRAGSTQLRLVRVSTSGEVSVGPVLEQLGRHAWPVLAGTPLRILYGRGQAAIVNDDLTLGPADRLPKEPITGGGVDDDVWIETFRARRDSDDLATQWWPLPPPDDLNRTLPREPRLTILDAAALTPHVSWSVDKPRSVAADGPNIWICDRKRLFRAHRHSTAQPVPIDVSAMITESIPPATGRERADE